MNHSVLGFSSDSIFEQERLENCESFLDAEGVLLRLGYTNDDGNQVMDTKVMDYYAIFNKIDIKIGYYWKSQATTVKEIETEITKIKELLEFKVNDFPIYIYYDRTCNRLANTDQDTLTNLIISSYAPKLKSAGFSCGVYAEYEFLQEKIITDNFTLNDIFLILFSNEVDNFEVYSDAIVTSSDGDPEVNDDKFDIMDFKKNVAQWDERTDISTVDLALESTDYQYNGEPRVPKVICQLVINTDYTVKYEDNINAGTGQVIVSGINKYKGFKILYFSIKAKSVATAEITCGAPDENLCYDLSQLGVTLDEEVLIEDKDFYKETSDKIQDTFINTTITIHGIGNFTGMDQETFPTGVTTYDIATKDISIDTSKIYTYSGQAIQPEVTVEELSLDTDYNIKYENNINAGNKAKIIVEGINNYHGKVQLYFTITPKDFTESGTTQCTQISQSDNYDLGTLKVLCGDTELTYGSDYYMYKSVEVEDNKKLISHLSFVGMNNYSGEFSASYKTADINIDTTDPDAEVTLIAGQKIELKNTRLFPRFGSFTTDMFISGTYYIWDERVKNYRIRVTKNDRGVGIPGNITGWVNITDILLLPEQVRLNNKVYIKSATMKEKPDGTGNNIYKEDTTLYVVEILKESENEYNYGLATARNLSVIAYAKREQFELL